MRDRMVEGECEVCGEELCEPDELDEDGYWEGNVPNRCDLHKDWEWDEARKCWVDEDGIEYDKDCHPVEPEPEDAEG